MWWDLPDWERKYSRELTPKKRLDISQSRGCAVIYAPDLAKEMGYARDTIFYFSWQESAVLRVYNSPSEKPKRIDLSKFGYSPADLSQKIVRGVTVPWNTISDRRPCTDARYWYNYIQNKKKQWLSEEGVEEVKPPNIAVNKDDSVPVANFSSSRQSDELNDIQAYLMEHRSDIYRYFHTTNDQWRVLTQHGKEFQAERVLVFLIGCGYALGKEQGVNTLTKILTGLDLGQLAHPRIWFEAQPIPPRMNEGNTHLDLALGAIARREQTANGIMLDDSPQAWICFCEAKFNSDISLGVTHDPNRNQLARVIENAICFQNSGRYANDVCVTIITPRAFSHRRPMLERKFYEYKTNPRSLADDLIKSPLIKRSTRGWFYPPENVLTQRVMSNLKLRRLYFEYLIENLPSSDISDQVKSLWGDIV